MRAYRGYIGDPSDGACLIFARTAKEAKKLCGVRVKWLRDDEYLLKYVRKGDEPYVIEAPPCCQVCGLWGTKPFVGCDGRRMCLDCESSQKEES